MPLRLLLPMKKLTCESSVISVTEKNKSSSWQHCHRCLNPHDPFVNINIVFEVVDSNL